MIQGVSRWCEKGSESFPATTECGESLTAMCFTLMPNEIRAQSADATETDASGWNPATRGSSEFIRSRLCLSWS